MRKTGVSANEMGKCKDKDMKVKDWIEEPDRVATKSLDVSVRGLDDIRDLRDAIKSIEIDAFAAKSLNISVGGLGSITKSAIMITERWDTSVNSRIRVSITINLSNPALVLVSFTSPRLGISIDTLTPNSFLSLHYRSDFIISLCRTSQATPGPQIVFWNQKIYCATSEFIIILFDDTQNLTL